jgi:probable HAF family extracellular repeat protein
MGERTRGVVLRNAGLNLLAAGSVLAGLSCSGDDIAGPTTGSIEITTATSGPEPDADGYTVQIDAEPARSIGAAATLQSADLSPGDHTVHLGGVASNCTVADNPRTVSIPAGGTATVSFEVACSATTGGLEVASSTTGPSPDADGYSLTVDGTDRGALGASGGLTLEALPPGTHEIGLSGIAGNCRVEGSNPQIVTITAGESAPVAFIITCTAPPASGGTLRIATSTTGPDPDPNGYAFAVDGGVTQPVAVNATIGLPNLTAGNHSVRLSRLAANCAVQGSNPRSVSVSAGATANVSFAVTCTATTGGIEVTTTTSGPSPDPDGYTITLDGTDRGPLEVSGAASLSGLAPGSHTVGLSGIAANCQVQGDNPRTITVTAGASTTAAFTVVCAAPPESSGTLRITTSTGGPEPDADGYAFAVDSGATQTIGVNATVTLANVAAGAHTVRLGGLAANCEVQRSNLHQVNVPAAGIADVSFVVLCRAVSTTYRVMSLGTLGGLQSGATAINDAGQVVGASSTMDGPPDDPDAPGGNHAFLWENGGIRDLGALAGGTSWALGINAAGQVVGSSTSRLEEICSGTCWHEPVDPHAFLWEAGGMTDLGTLGGNTSHATGINSAGQVVGVSETAAGAFRAFLWENGSMMDLGTLGGDGSRAAAINTAGQVVGTSVTAAGENHAFLWQNVAMIDLGTLGGSSSEANAINSLGHVVGMSTTAEGDTHAFLWKDGVMTDLGTLGGPISIARGINSAGQVVGMAYTEGWTDRAFVWENGVMTDLGSEGPVYEGSGAWGINATGAVVGESIFIAPQATLWTRD